MGASRGWAIRVHQRAARRRPRDASGPARCRLDGLRADPPTDYVQPFTQKHWDVVEAIIRDPDGRQVSLQAPLPAGIDAADAEAHHREKYGTS